MAGTGGTKVISSEELESESGVQPSLTAAISASSSEKVAKKTGKYI
ncbi:hypothetical protein LEQ07_14900 [Paraclostridium sp. AKS73]|nr:hypothetical protein [Paraclostridium sp. AKS73]